MSQSVVPNFTLEYDPWGRLVLIDSSGERHVDVAPARAFPLSDPGHWVSLCAADGREILVVPSLAELADPLRRTIEAELRRNEFVPVIQRIVSVTLDSEPAEWNVLTDRGPTTFFTDGNDAVRRTDANRCLITDMQGVRYLILDREWLDADSRRLLESYF